MNGRWEAEARRQAILDTLPLPSAIVAAVHAAMVLLIQAVRHPRRHHEAMHALTVVGIVVPLGQEIGSGPPVARLPCLAPVYRVEDTACRDPDPDLRFILGVKDERMQHQPAAARLPLGPRWVIAQP